MRKNVNVANLAGELRPTPGVVGRAITVGNTITDLGALADHTRYVMLQVQAQPVRITFDGEDPSASSGFRYAANDVLVLNATAAAAAQLIREGGSDATVYVQELTQ